MADRALKNTRNFDVLSTYYLHTTGYWLSTKRLSTVHSLSSFELYAGRFTTITIYRCISFLVAQNTRPMVKCGVDLQMFTHVKCGC